MGVQIHMRHGNGEYNNSYARVEDFVDDRDVVVHAKGSCDPCIKKEKEVIANDYNLDINKPKINGIELVGNKTTEDLLIDQNFVKDDNYIHTDNNFTNALKEKLENFSEIQISNSEPTDTNIELWYQIDSDIDLDNFDADIIDNDLNITYQDGLGLDFNIENNELIVTNDIEGLDFIINENQELEVEYGN